MARSRTKPANSNDLPRRSFRKWIKLDAASYSLSDAARMTIESRIAAVEAYLPLAAYHHEETIEHVHQLRVSSRRALAALLLYKDHLPRKHRKWMQKMMKRVRKAAGEARDLDVLLDRFEKSEDAELDPLIRYLHQLRHKSQKSIVKLCDRLTDDHQLERHAMELSGSIPIQRQANLEQFAKSQIEYQADLFLAYTPEDLFDIDELHRFRVQAKEFRYTIELLSDVLPSSVRSQIYPAICQTQEMLGELNDHAIACKRFKDLSAVSSIRSIRKQLKRLSRGERDQVADLKKQFHDWWTPKTSRKFETTVRAAIDGPRSVGAAS